MSNHQTAWIQTVRTTLKNADTDYFKIRPLRYWFDFLSSAALAYIAANIYLCAPLFSIQQFAAFPIAVLLLYRSGSLIHEVAHLPHKQLRGFKVAWNLVVGVVTLAPSTFFTAHHRDHHSGRTYGTPQDPEYVVNVFRRGSVLSVLLYGLHIFLFPSFVFLRFLLAPLSWLHPRIRDFTLRRLSSFTLNWNYEKNLSRFNSRSFVAIELLCSARAWLMLLCVAAGFTLWTRIPMFYLLAAGTLLFNQLRQLADHHFQSDGKNMTLAEHIADSCNHTHADVLAWLFNPFAIRYHALHHLFPSMPYHNLKSAHVYLSDHLPADSPYHDLDESSWWGVARRTFANH